MSKPMSPGRESAHHRVEVGAVVVRRRAHLVHDRGDLLDVGVEQPERVGVGEHQAGHVRVGLRAQVVEVDAAGGVGGELDDLQPGHRDRRRVGAVRGVGGEHLAARLAAVLVVGAGQQHARQLALRAGRGLQRDVRQAGDLRERALQVPHQLERALRALGVLQRVKPRVPGQRGDPLVQARVVLHRARPERVEAGVEVEVALGQAARSGARSPALRPRAAAARCARRKRAGSSSCASTDRERRAAGTRTRGAPARPSRRSSCAVRAAAAISLAAPGVTPRPPRARPRQRAPSTSASRSMSARERRSVIATSRPPRSSGRPVSACRSTPGLTPCSAQRRVTAATSASRRTANSRITGCACSVSTPVERGERLARVVRAREQQLAQLDDPAAPQPGQVDDAGERVERLRGADVRGGLLAADVLLAGLQRQHEPAPPVDVDGLPGDPAGHAPQVLLARGEEAEGGPAEVQAVAERLALADGHVDAALARGLEDAERDRVDLADHDGRWALGGRLRGGAQRLGVLDRAVEVRLREDRGARVRVDRLAPTRSGSVTPSRSGTSTTSIP